MLYLITATFSHCFLLQAAAKVQELYKDLKMLRLQNTGDYVIYNPQALSSALASLGHHNPGPLGYKFRRPLRFEV